MVSLVSPWFFFLLSFTPPCAIYHTVIYCCTSAAFAYCDTPGMVGLDIFVCDLRLQKKNVESELEKEISGEMKGRRILDAVKVNPSLPISLNQTFF